MHKLIKPIVFFDLETTGTSITRDRIVQIAAAKISPLMEEGWELKKVLINPLMPIPPGATKVHGITDEMVADKPAFSSYAKAIKELMTGCNLGGFNIRKFDVPLLAEEFARVGISFPEPDTKYFDSCDIFHKMEPRDLTAAVMFYTGRKLDGAHDAGNDVHATVEVFKEQMKRYEQMQAMSEEELDIFCAGGKRTLDLAGKIGTNENGEAIYTFGKSIGKRLIDDPGFGQWMLKEDTDFSMDTKNVVRRVLYGKR